MHSKNKTFRFAGILFFLSVLVQATLVIFRGGSGAVIGHIFGLLAGIIVVLTVGWFVNNWLHRYERAAAEMSESGSAWVCIPEFQSSYRLLSSDEQYLTLWRLSHQKAITVMKWPKDEITVQKTNVQVSEFKAFEGISIASPTTIETKLAVYDTNSGLLAQPIQGAKLDAVISILAR